MSADLLQDMINLSIEMEKYIKPLSESGNAAIEEKRALEDELKFVKEQLTLGEQRQAELQATIDKYQELIENKKTERADFQEVKEELKLLNEDMEKIDMVRAGCVSHDSQATEGSLYSNLPGQQQV
jgi:chromosome segregation ATPase